MKRQLGLGAAVGAGVALMCWRGNQEANTMSTFPDWATFLVLVVLLALAVRAELRRGPTGGRATALVAGVTIATGTGVMFGPGVVVLAALRLAHPSPALLLFSFMIAFVSALICGVVAAVAWSSMRRGRAA